MLTPMAVGAERRYLARLWWAVPCLVLIVGIDAWTKLTVHTYFTQRAHLLEVPVWSDILGIDFAITYTSNRGAAWGWLAEWQSWLLLLRVGMVVMLAVYLCLSKMSGIRFFALSLITAGALGNIIDTLVYGYVVDFLLFTFWGYDFAVFNIADSTISIGVALVLIDMLMRKELPRSQND